MNKNKILEERVQTLLDNQSNSMDIIAQLQRDKDQLREALLALRDDGVWVGGEWVPSEEAQSMADVALKATEDE